MSDEDPLARCYDAHAKGLFAYLLSLTHEEEDARDLLQETFLRLARQPDLLDAARSERAVLFRIAHNLAMDLHRRRTVRDRFLQSQGAQDSIPFAPAEDPDEAAFRAEAARALSDLPPEQRAVVHLKLWEGFTFEQIARVLEISPNTAASRYRYALDKLRIRLRRWVENSSQTTAGTMKP